ncbi:GGDEF domain-containing protein [Sulfuriferula sp. AH1]|uniref:GGDEF domain-containing protein n=1 Tax=Sulfuriferula sp. AH1 TaxID=1985873 RepID=UPI000B3B7DE3|nr:GGDEF domain-containing protein [Sulfuriferula sp. AH1]ARU31512.1 GGDEF domain-containing protein [Sulfuriferula sp. AH1]
MKNTPENEVPQNPAEIAREAFRRLAMQRIAPTPEAYRTVYNEIAGLSEAVSAEQILTSFAAQLSQLTGETSIFGKRLRRAAEAHDWQDYNSGLTALIEEQLKSPPVTATVATSSPVQTIPVDGQNTQVLRELLTRTLTFAVASLLSNIPELAEESEALGTAIRDARTDEELTEIGKRLKQLCFRIELKSGDIAEQQDLLLRLFRLLLDNISYLLDDDSWLRGQIDVVQNLISGPINHRSLEDATQGLKEIIYKQGTLKDSLSEAKITVKNMITIFIDRLGAIATSTGDYHGKIDSYTHKIAKAQHIGELNTILDDVMRDTRSIQAEALQSRDQMLAARQEAQVAEARIHALETELAEISALASHDQLTKSLNRRGLDEAFEREQSRADRHGTALSVAMLDIDDFKKINDTYGHEAGDEALIHVVRIIKETLRSMDVIGRFGGEEFVVVLPDTPENEGIAVIARLQKELTKRIFMHNNQKLFVTFSAGLATRNPGENLLDTMKRADSAMYKAKKLGKNRVIAAD